MPSDPNARLPRRSLLFRGTLTLVASTLLQQTVAVATLLITARLLTPQDFGIATFIVVATTLLELLQRQITLPLIRMRAPSTSNLRAMFGFQLLLGALATALLAIAALALHQNSPDSSISRLSTFSIAIPFVVMLRSPGFVLFERDLSFQWAAGEVLVNQIAYAASAVYLSFVLGNFWALVLATVIAQAAKSVFTFAAAPMAPVPSLAVWRDSLGFSLWASGSQIAVFLSQRLPQIAIAVALGAAAGGLYRVGDRITRLVIANLTGPISRVAYPGIADAIRTADTSGTARMFEKLNQVSLGVVLPCGIGIALISGDLVRLALGPGWQDAALVIAVLAPLRALDSIHSNVRSILFAAGDPRPIFVRNWLLAGLTGAFVWAGSISGLTGAIIGVASAGAIGVLLSLIVAQKRNPGRLTAPLEAGWRSLLAGAIMVAAVLALDAGLGAAPSAQRSLLHLGLKIFSGAAVYIGVHMVAWIAAGAPDGIERVAVGVLAGARKRYISAS